MALQLAFTSQFKKDYKRLKKRGLNLSKLHEVIDRLRKQSSLDAKHQDHALTGNYVGFRECHIRPDWLLIYAIDKEMLVLTAVRTSSHSDLFGK